HSLGVNPKLASKSATVASYSTSATADPRRWRSFQASHAARRATRCGVGSSGKLWGIVQILIRPQAWCAYAQNHGPLEAPDDLGQLRIGNARAHQQLVREGIEVTPPVFLPQIGGCA